MSKADIERIAQAFLEGGGGGAVGPMMETGRKHAREVMHSAARLVNHANGTTKRADAASTLSTPRQRSRRRCNWS